MDLSQAMAKPRYLCRQVYLDSLAQLLPSETGAFRSQQLKLQKEAGEDCEAECKNWNGRTQIWVYAEWGCQCPDGAWNSLRMTSI